MKIKSHCALVIDNHFEETDCTIDFDYVPEDPGRYTGPWENCYPREPEEVIINSITAYDGTDIFELVSDAETERLEMECAEHARSNRCNHD